MRREGAKESVATRKILICPPDCLQVSGDLSIVRIRKLF